LGGSTELLKVFFFESALHNKNNEKSIIPNPQIVQGDKQDCVIEDGVFHDNLSKNSMAFIDHIPRRNYLLYFHFLINLAKVQFPLPGTL
jgi:hypothetical protein